MEFTEEEKKSYQERLRLREAREKAKQEQAKQEHSKSTPEFKSRLGRGAAKVLTSTANKAEELRSKADYLSGQAGRIKKAITSHGPPKGKVPPQLRQYLYKAKPPRRYRNVSRLRTPVYQQRYANDAYADLIYGKQQKNTGMDVYGDLINGKKTGGSPSEFINDMALGKPSKKKDPFKDLLG